MLTKKRCLKDENCPFKEEAKNTKCWGYEKNCTVANTLFEVTCPGDSGGWVCTFFK